MPSRSAPDPRALERAVRAVDAAGTGDLARARRLIDEITGDASCGVDRALAHLAAASVARLDGDAAEAGRCLERATREIAVDGGGPSLIQSLLAQLGTPPWVARRIAAPDAGYDVVLDGRSHELRVKRRVISFRARPVLRKLLYTLASQPAAPVSRQALVTGVWDVVYNPLRHDNTLWVNVRRLRMSLADSGLKIEAEDEAYRLIVPERFLYIAATL